MKEEHSSWLLLAIRTFCKLLETSKEKEIDLLTLTYTKELGYLLMSRGKQAIDNEK
jgi:hypothetical protein